MFKKYNKGISGVVATALVLVLAVVSVVGFQTWFGSYSSGIYSGAETKSNNGLSGSVSVEAILEDVVYIKSGYKTNLTSLKVGSTECTLDHNNLSVGVNKVIISDCLGGVNSGTSQEVFLTTSDGNSGSSASKKVIVKHNGY